MHTHTHTHTPSDFFHSTGGCGHSLRSLRHGEKLVLPFHTDPDILVGGLNLGFFFYISSSTGARGPGSPIFGI